MRLLPEINADLLQHLATRFFRPAVNNGGLPKFISPLVPSLPRGSCSCGEPTWLPATPAVSGKTRPVSSRVRLPACLPTHSLSARACRSDAWVCTNLVFDLPNKSRQKKQQQRRYNRLSFSLNRCVFRFLRIRKSLSAAQTLHRKYYISPVEVFFFFSAEVKTLPSGCCGFPV